MATVGGRGSRARAKERRKKERRQQAQAQQAKYESWRDQGINSKSKRNVLAGKRKSRTPGHPHVIWNCGNVGCKNCFPEAK